MKLPLKYTETMKALLGEEYDAYLASFDEERFYGLRVNTLKISAEEMAARGVFSLRPVPWCETGFYYDGAERPAKHPYYHAGLYYLQEPSAMSPAATLPIEKGDRVLDLCAAPGGKTTQLGARLGGTGLLVANDISAGRAKTLLKNVELAGIRNAIVMSETPERIAERLPNFFDKILVDAPCSGEGMFRKEPDMVKSWDAEMLAFCRSEQAKILEACAPMLKAGGMLLYSTCTFSPEENEKSIGNFLERHPEFELMPIAKKNGFAEGLAPYTDCARLYPHRLKGEGHFLALFRKKETADEPVVSCEQTRSGLRGEEKELWEAFGENLNRTFLPERMESKNGMVYYMPKELPKMRGLRFLRSGLFVGEMKKKRFEPSQSLAMALRAKDYKNCLRLSVNDERVVRYLKGETLVLTDEEAAAKDGWQLVCVEDYPLGWGKKNKHNLKNKYHSGWRMV